MQNKMIWVAIILVLIISLIAIYFTFTTPTDLQESLDSLIERNRNLEKETQLLTQKVAPYIYAGEAVGYVIEFENGAKFYFAGDTGVFSDLKLIGDYYRPDIVFLPISNLQTMDPKAAAYAASLVNPEKYIIPYRYASFPALTQDPDQFFQELKKYRPRADPLELEIGKERTLMGIKVEWLGHGDFLFENPKGTRILIDPEVRYNPSFPEKYKELTQLKRIEIILITHGHFDQMTFSDLKKWGDLFDPIFIAPYETGIWLKENLPQESIMPINKGSRISKKQMLDLGLPEERVEKISEIVINVVPATHSSSITPEGVKVP